MSSREPSPLHLETLEDRWCPDASLLGVVAGLGSAATSPVAALVHVSLQLPPLGVQASLGSANGDTLVTLRTPLATAQVGTSGVQAAVLPGAPKPVVEVTVPLTPTAPPTGGVPAPVPGTPTGQLPPPPGIPGLPTEETSPPAAGQAVAPPSSGMVPTLAASSPSGVLFTTPSSATQPVTTPTESASPAGQAVSDPTFANAAPELSAVAPTRMPNRTPEFAAGEEDDTAEADEQAMPDDDVPQEGPNAMPETPMQEAPAAAFATNLRALEEGLDQLLAGLNAAGRQLTAILPGLDGPAGYAVYLTALAAVGVGAYTLLHRNEEEAEAETLLVDHPSMPIG